MRVRFPAIVLALSIVGGGAQAQVIKAEGAAAAGVCAGAFEMLGEFMSRAPDSTPEGIANVSAQRDFFAELPQYDREEIKANAEAFIRLMSGRLSRASTPAEQRAVTKEIVDLARGCFRTAEAARQSGQASGGFGTAPAPSPSAPLNPLQPDPGKSYVPQGEIK